ncbi:g12694 [Coccomyxa viridis]|uniref:G12694 protein n=1 Tax=Coccomyxa viridis TaxID=1274662 RepID=A0ABP1GDL1_9CHLO
MEASQQAAQNRPQQEDYTAEHAQGSSQGGSAGSEQGSPGMPKQAGKQESPHDVEAPATPQLHAPPTAVPAEEFSQKGFEAEKQTQQQEHASTLEPGSAGMHPATPAPPTRRSGRRSLHSAMSSGMSSEPSIAMSIPAAAKQHPFDQRAPTHYAVGPSMSSKENLPPKPSKAGTLQSMRAGLTPCLSDEALLSSPAKPLDATGQLGSSASMPGNFGQGSGTSLCTPAQKRMCPHSSWNSSPQEPSRAAAERPASRLAISSSHALPPPSSEPLQCSGGTALGSATPVRKEQPSVSCGAPEPQATSPQLGSKELPHPLSPKGKSICRPDWRTGSPGKARAWLMYKKVLHRGHCGGADDFQTVSVELPTETLKKRRPEFGNKTFLALESRLEDDMNIPLKARAANYQRKKILKRNAGIAPQAGHEDYKWYRQCCKACKNYY